MCKTKKCSKCGGNKSLNDFHTRKVSKDGRAYLCKECNNRRNKKYSESKQGKKVIETYYRKNRDKILQRGRAHYRTERGRDVKRRGHFKQRYGITLEQHEQLYVIQNGCCKICGEPVAYDKVCVDHDHKTNMIRGLLCNRCNTGIGLLGDTLEKIMRAVRYLEGIG